MISKEAAFVFDNRKILMRSYSVKDSDLGTDLEAFSISPGGVLAEIPM
jgi:hypothetical protein